MADHYRLLFSTEFDRDLDDVPAYDAVKVRSRVAILVQQGEVASRNRKRLAEPVSWCPEANWQLRVGHYRILYRAERGVVRVLRLTFKGRKTTEEMGR
jgi:mRNA-degrading endonuclease RelE of RelBE toxin-antitoxin system